MREGGKPLPLAFQYLIFILGRSPRYIVTTEQIRSFNKNYPLHHTKTTVLVTATVVEIFYQELSTPSYKNHSFGHSYSSRNILPRMQQKSYFWSFLQSQKYFDKICIQQFWSQLQFMEINIGMSECHKNIDNYYGSNITVWIPRCAGREAFDGVQPLPE